MQITSIAFHLDPIFLLAKILSDNWSLIIGNCTLVINQTIPSVEFLSTEGIT